MMDGLFKQVSRGYIVHVAPVSGSSERSARTVLVPLAKKDDAEAASVPLVADASSAQGATAGNLTTKASAGNAQAGTDSGKQQSPLELIAVVSE
eukprot:6182836-Pleurochrysis_carterae.AAC.1